MALTVTHTFVSAVADAGNPNEVGPNEWNAAHTVTGSLGGVVQIVNTQTGAVASGSTVTPFDDTIPQITEGVEFMTLAITPTSSTNKLRIEVVFVGATSGTTPIIMMALHQDTTANAIAVVMGSSSAANNPTTIALSHTMTAGTTSATTFRVRVGGYGAATITFNGSGGIRYMGGAMASSIAITEYTP